MITIKELQLDDETALKLMRLIKCNEPGIWKVFKPLVKQALNKHIVSNNEAVLACSSCKWQYCKFEHKCESCISGDNKWEQAYG